MKSLKIMHSVKFLKQIAVNFTQFSFLAAM